MDKCFMIMPITTPSNLRKVYSDDAYHFRHVLEHLFVPAITRSGMEPILPAVSGGDVIQAEIIRNLETAELVLCDMSTLNANVFFELGIRTALDRPVAIVRDELTSHIPFDTSIINYHVYSSGLRPWELEKETESLMSHLEAVRAQSTAGNSLWKYFGITRLARPLGDGGSLDEKVDLILREITVLRRGFKTRLPETDVAVVKARMERYAKSFDDIYEIKWDAEQGHFEVQYNASSDWRPENPSDHDILQAIARPFVVSFWGTD